VGGIGRILELSEESKDRSAWGKTDQLSLSSLRERTKWKTRIRKNELMLRDQWVPSSASTSMLRKSQVRAEERNRKSTRKTNDWKHLNLKENINVHMAEAYQTPRRINLNRATPQHNLVQLELLHRSQRNRRLCHPCKADIIKHCIQQQQSSHCKIKQNLLQDRPNEKPENKCLYM
jgi:hypothetical protein